MRKSSWLTTGGAAGLLALAVALVFYKKRPKSVLSRLPEEEDVDAYNTDDGQPPFEEHDPRQRHAKRGFRRSARPF